MQSIIFVCVFAFAVSAIAGKAIIEDQGWHIWKSSHNKAYSDLAEERVRYFIWKDNMQRIEEFNEKSKNKLYLRINHFGDMTNTEFKAKMNGFFTSRVNSSGSMFLSPHNLVLPKAVDWREEGLVTPVKNQGQCGSCWAFSTTGSLEGQHKRKSGKLVSLSEQNLVDCSAAYGNHGCQGGLMDNAFRYIQENGGLDTEKSYPYEAELESCEFKKKKVGATVTGYVDIPEGDEDALQNATATVGPISVAIDASHFSFQFYHEGVYDEENCNAEQLDHGVLVVGYGSEDGNDYWLVKNSWGESWGLGGYIKMSRNKENQCGIASAASYPLV